MTTKPRRKPFPANAKTIAFLRAAGYIAETVEHMIPKCFIRRDLFGCLDILAMHADKTGMLGVQATSGGGSKGQSNGLARRRKLVESENARLFVQTGNRLWLVVWGLNAKGKWEPAIEVLDIDAFAEVTP